MNNSEDGKMAKENIPEEIMAERRKERLERLNFFMLNPKCPPNAVRCFTLHESHNLLTGFFQNSHWQTAFFCLKRATWNSWTHFKIDCQFFYYRKILRLSNEQIDARLDADD